MEIKNLVRKNILSLKPYSSARHEFKGEASVHLDANENPLNTKYNRYPDPLQLELKDRVAQIKNINTENIFFGNGSDEPIDIVYRVFCEPTIDNVVAIDPTYGMYKVCADINNVEYKQVLLDNEFSLNGDNVLEATNDNTKLIFLCSPNNPTGNLLDRYEIVKIITSFKGIVVLDEAYIDFSIQNSFLPELKKYPNLIILQTFSKAWGLAAVRLGMAFASAEIICYFNNVKYPYNINILTQNFVLEELSNIEKKDQWVKTLISERHKLEKALQKISYIKKIYPSDSNFILIKVDDANKIYNTLVNNGIIIRNRNTISLCQGCLRITVGSPEENLLLIKELQKI